MHLSVFSRNRTEPTDQFSLVRVGSVCSGSGRVSWVLFLIFFNFFVFIYSYYYYCYFLLLLFSFFYLFLPETEPNLLTSSVWFGSAQSGSVWVGSEQYIYIQCWIYVRNSCVAWWKMSYSLCIWSCVRISQMSFIFQVKIKMDKSVVHGIRTWVSQV